MPGKTQDDIADEECVRDPIFVLAIGVATYDDDGNESGTAFIPGRVFATREAAERYGRRHDRSSYSGWRVYCVPAEGELARILGKAD